MKYLVTGCAGFIGSHVTQELLKNGHKVIGIDNLNDYYDPRIKGDNVVELLLDDNFTFYKIDINDFKRLESVFEREDIDRVIHLAARAGVRASISDPLIYIKTNINGTVNLLELARRYNIQNFVFASSSSVYGERDDVPFKETDEIKPISQYAATKKSGELLGYTYNHLYKLPFIGLRFFTVYGPKGRPDMAPYKFMKAILNDEVITIYGDGSSLRDYTYVGDIVRGILLSSEKDLGYEIINLGSSKPIKLLDFVETFEKVTGKKAKIKHVEKQPGDVSKTYADTTKAQELLGWQALFDLNRGLEQVYLYFKEKNNWR